MHSSKKPFWEPPFTVYTAKLFKLLEPQLWRDCVSVGSTCVGSGRSFVVFMQNSCVEKYYITVFGESLLSSQCLKWQGYFMQLHEVSDFPQ